MFKDELDGMVMTEFCVPRAKTYAFKYDENGKTKEKKKPKGTKECVIKNDLTFEAYKSSVLKNKIILRSQQQFKIDNHSVFTEVINEIEISSNDDKRIQDLDGIATHAYGTPPTKVCESEMLIKKWGKPIALYY